MRRLTAPVIGATRRLTAAVGALRRLAVAVIGAVRRLAAYLLGNATVDLNEAKVLLAARREQAPNRANLRLAITSLDTLLGRLLEAKQQLDTKAAVIIPATAAIVGLGADRATAAPEGIVLVVGWGVLVAAVLAVLHALGALLAANHAGGPGEMDAALLTSEPDSLRYGQEIADALVISVLDTSRLLSTKAARFNRALGFAAVAVILLLIFVALGGWAQPQEAAL